MSTYSGNSPGKSDVRAWAYNHVQKKMGARFYTGTHIVISSKECGDIRYLVEHNVPKSNIIACDTDIEARRAALSWGVRLSNKEAIHETTEAFAEDNLASVNVDLCNPLPYSMHILIYTLNALKRCKHKVPVLYTFLKGRDDMRGDWNGEETQRDAYIEDRLSGLLTGVTKRMYSKVIAYRNYQSNTYNRYGSPMRVAIL